MTTSAWVPEPVTSEPPPGRVGRTLLTQSWLDAAFLHWALDPAAVAPLLELPPGTVPDVLDGVTYVGLIAFRMFRIGWLGLPGMPYLGSFPETNVRLYCVDGFGRRGVVFRSLEASRLIPVFCAQAGFRLPYRWAKMSIHRAGQTITYASRRRWPGPLGARSLINVRIGDRIAAPTPLDDFLTARWALHNSTFGRTVQVPNEHPQWPLYRAELLDLDEDLIAAAGLHRPEAAPVSVLYSPGVRVRFGMIRSASSHPR